METILFTVSLILCVVSFCFLLFFRKKYLHYHNRLQMSLSSEKSYLSENLNLQNNLKSLKADLFERTNVIASLKKEKFDYLEQQNEYKQIFLKKEEEIVAKLEQLECKKEHLETQVCDLTKQLANFDFEKKEIRLKYETLNSEEKKQNQLSFNNLKTEINRLKKALNEQKESNKKISNLLDKERSDKRKVDPEEIIKFKKKLKQYQQFYTVNSSQREMLEERLENWELALRILSSWTLKNYNNPKKDTKSIDTNNLGELVATALEIINQGSLVEDEFCYFKPVKKPLKKVVTDSESNSNDINSECNLNTEEKTEEISAELETSKE